MSGIFYFVFDIDMQRCEMTYMFEYPDYKQYTIPDLKHNKSLNRYRLFYYSEGGVTGVPRGVPVVFIPGNSGSYKQVRSLASVSRQISLSRHKHQLFDYFTIDFREELSAASAPLIGNQIDFVIRAIQFILETIYDDTREIVLIGHSIGGFVARTTLIRPEIRALNCVKVVVCLASPLEVPVAGLDPGLADLYRWSNEQWASERFETVLVSITGGNRDVLVWDGYGRLTDSTKQSIWVPTLSIKGVWASTDHLCILWCRQLILAINRALYQCLNQSGRIKGATNDILSVFQSVLVSPDAKCSRSTTTPIDYSFMRLLFQSQQIQLNDSQHSCIPVNTLTHVTRPLRLQISSSGCQDDISSVDLVLSSQNHTYRHYLHTDQSVLLSIPVSTRNGPIPLVYISRKSTCHYTVSIYASLVDWVAYLIRIHFGRVPCFIAATLILRLLPSGPLSWFAFAMSSISSLLMTSDSTDLGRLYQMEMIDVYDFVFLLCLSIPLAYCISIMVVICIRLLISVFKLLSFAYYQTVYSILGVIILFPVLIVILSSKDTEMLATVCLFLFYLLSVATFRRSKSALEFSRQTIFASILLILCIIQTPPWISNLHAAMQHNSLRNIIRERFSVLGHFPRYECSYALLFLVATITFNVTREVPSNPKNFQSNLMTQLANAIIFASGCVVYGAIDICQCIPFLAGALITSEIVHFVNL